jgi:protein SCO1
LKGFNKFKNGVILFVVFLIPVFLTLFLKYCGENHFAVPVFYRDGVTQSGRPCISDSAQYRIKIFPFVELNGNPCDTSEIRGRFSVLSVCDTARRLPDERIISNLRRVISDINRPDAVQAFIIFNNYSPAPVPPVNQDTHQPVKYVKGSISDIFRFGRCGLILPPDSLFDKIVLADQQGRIRGYYDADRFNEYDRLMVELKILLREEYLK